MIDSSMKTQQEESYQQQQQQQRRRRRLCDYCNEATALLYCRADSAKLCFSCDKEVHSTNQLFAKHSRSQLCDGCDDAPSSVFCETEQKVLCQNCDWESHNNSTGVSSGHGRRPVEGFNGCPSVMEMAGIVGFDDLGEKALFFGEVGENGGGFGGLGDDLVFWESRPEIFSINDLVVSGSGSGHNFRAMDVPPLPKNRNASCGKHKEEMLRQLRELAKSEPNLNYENAVVEPDIGFQFLVPEPNLAQENLCTDSKLGIDQISFPSCQVSEFQWLGDNYANGDHDVLHSPFIRSFTEENSSVSHKMVDISGSLNNANDGHEENSQIPITPRTLPRHEINSQERDSALSRYKEKKKTRRYDKHIRYESRKVRAETRTRVRGRFAKMDR